MKSFDLFMSDNPMADTKQIIVNLFSAEELIKKLSSHLTLNKLSDSPSQFEISFKKIFSNHSTESIVTNPNLFSQIESEIESLIQDAQKSIDEQHRITWDIYHIRKMISKKKHKFNIDQDYQIECLNVLKIKLIEFVDNFTISDSIDENDKSLYKSYLDNYNISDANIWNKEQIRKQIIEIDQKLNQLKAELDGLFARETVTLHLSPTSIKILRI